ncbi:Hydroxyethylthiazole kinase [Bienertia sinuspersici]
MSGSSSIVIEPTSPLLYLHPSDGTNSMSIEKLNGASNYRTWGVKRDVSDRMKQECWDTCKNTKSVMFMTNASDIRRHMEKSYSITNGANKYSLNKQLDETNE